MYRKGDNKHNEMTKIPFGVLKIIDELILMIYKYITIHARIKVNLK